MAIQSAGAARYRRCEHPSTGQRALQQIQRSIAGQEGQDQARRIGDVWQHGLGVACDTQVRLQSEGGGARGRCRSGADENWSARSSAGWEGKPPPNPSRRRHRAANLDGQHGAGVVQDHHARVRQACDQRGGRRCGRCGGRGCPARPAPAAEVTNLSGKTSSLLRRAVFREVPSKQQNVGVMNEAEQRRPRRPAREAVRYRSPTAARRTVGIPAGSQRESFISAPSLSTVV